MRMGLLALLLATDIQARDEVALYIGGISSKKSLGWSAEDVGVIKWACLDLADATPLTIAIVLECLDHIALPDRTVEEIVHGLAQHDDWLEVVQTVICGHEATQPQGESGFSYCAACGVVLPEGR